MVIDAEPGRDDAQPWVEPALPGEPGHRAVGANESFLGDLLGFVGIADPLEAEAVHALEVAAVEVLEGAAVPGLEQLDESLVPPQIYVVSSYCQVRPALPTGPPVVRKDSCLLSTTPSDHGTSVETFDYALPNDRIAQEPLADRAASKLLVATDPGGAVEHRAVRHLPELVGPGDLLVLNTTRVMPARLRLRKATGGAAEVLVLSVDDDGAGTALVRPGRRIPPGTVLFDGETAVVEVGGHEGDGERHVRLLAPLADHGVVPLPPYITTPLADPERYQTVYADRPTSAAAPTAGLHLTQAVLDGCVEAGATVATVELAVGVATFQPITTEAVEDHRMHAEAYSVPKETLAAVRAARRVIAIGTTSVRALESAMRGRPAGQTDLFIRAPFRFEAVDVLLTNFHMPRSSLLVLLDAFVGPRWRRLYDVALAEGYRFLSFGDAMLVART